MTHSPTPGPTLSRSALRMFPYLWIASILAVCLGPVGGRTASLGICIICGTQGSADMVLNLALYVPLGFALRLRGWSFLGALALCAGLSVGVEIAQIWIPGRFATLGDLMANTSGGAVGGLLGRAPKSLLLPDVHEARRLGIVWASIVTSWMVGATILLQPSVPDGPLYGNWTPNLGSEGWYDGSVLSADIGGLGLPSRLLEDPEEVRNRLRRGVPVSLTFAAGESSDRPLPLFRLMARYGREVVRVDTHGADMVLRPRLLATEFRFANPSLRFHSALAGMTPGDTVSIGISYDPSEGYLVSGMDAGPFRSAITLSRSWTLLRNLTFLSPATLATMDTFWVLGLLLPFGWWGVAPIATIPLSAMALLPHLFGMQSSPVAHFVLGLVGILAAASLRKRITTQ